MKCVVRIRNNNNVEVFTPRKYKARELMQELYDEECIRIGSVKSKINDEYASVEGLTSKTMFYIRALVEVEK